MIFKSNPSGTRLASPKGCICLSLPGTTVGHSVWDSTERRTQRDLFMLQT